MIEATAPLSTSSSMSEPPTLQRSRLSEALVAEKLEAATVLEALLRPEAVLPLEALVSLEAVGPLEAVA